MREGKISPVISLTRYLILGGYCILLWIPLCIFFLVSTQSLVYLLRDSSEFDVAIHLLRNSLRNPWDGFANYWSDLLNFLGSEPNKPPETSSLLLLINLIVVVGFLLDPFIQYLKPVVYNLFIGRFLKSPPLKKSEMKENKSNEYKPNENKSSICAKLRFQITGTRNRLSCLFSNLSYYISNGLKLCSVYLVFLLISSFLYRYDLEDLFNLKRFSNLSLFIVACAIVFSLPLVFKLSGWLGLQFDSNLEIERERMDSKNKEKKIRYWIMKRENKSQCEKNAELDTILERDKKYEKYQEFLFKEKGRVNRYDSLLNWIWKTGLVISCQSISVALAFNNLFVVSLLLNAAHLSELTKGIPNELDPRGPVDLLPADFWLIWPHILLTALLTLYFFILIKVRRDQEFEFFSFKDTIFTMFEAFYDNQTTDGELPNE